MSAKDDKELLKRLDKQINGKDGINDKVNFIYMYLNSEFITSPDGTKGNFVRNVDEMYGDIKGIREILNPKDDPNKGSIARMERMEDFIEKDIKNKEERTKIYRTFFRAIAMVLITAVVTYAVTELRKDDSNSNSTIGTPIHVDGSNISKEGRDSDNVRNKQTDDR